MQYYPNPEASITYDDVNAAVERAFANHCEGEVQMPPKVYIHFMKGDFRTMPAYIPALDIAGVKIVNVHPENRTLGLPTVMAVTVIIDVGTGLPTAILNATQLTDFRTGAAGAVAAKYLAPRKEIVLGLVGSGRQAEAQLEAISRECGIEEIRVWSRNEKNAESFVAKFSRFEGRHVGLERACDCDVLCTTTPSRSPVVQDAWIHDGTHINAIGADAPGKQELDPALLLRASVFIDDYEQAIHSGEINMAITGGVFSPSMIAGTLGEVVCGRKGRKRRDEITVFDSTGLAIQDLAIAKIALGKGESIPLPFP
jgi:alanine dehydrogenase